MASRSARPGVVAWRMPRHSSSSRRPGPASRGRRHSDVRSSSDREAVKERPFTDPMLSCGLRCRPLSRGGSAVDARCSRRPKGSGGTHRPPHPHRHPHHPRPRQPCSPRAPGRSSPWPRTTTTRRACPIPRTALNDLDFDQQTLVYDRDRQGRAGPPRLAPPRGRRRSTRSRGEMLDATTAIEDKDFWINPGFDPVGIVAAGLDTLAGRPRGASTITQQLVRARLLPGGGVRGLDLRAQVPRDHPVDPPDRGVPGRGGQAGDHHRLPQPELLRQQLVRREGGRQGLLRQGPRATSPWPSTRSSRRSRSPRPSSTCSRTPRRSASTKPPPRRAPSARRSSSRSR